MTGGPTLEQYLETRFNLIQKSIEDAQAATDLRYQQRFDASQKALELGFASQKTAVDAAFLSQQTAMKVAFEVAEKAVQAALAAADRAVSKAELAADKRFEGVNEFRGTLADQQRTLMPRSEVEVLMRSMYEKLNTLEKIVEAARAERVGLKGGYGYAIGVLGVLLTVMSIIGYVVTLIRLKG